MSFAFLAFKLIPIYFRVLWFLLLLGMMCLTGFLVEPILNKYLTSPTITTVSSTNYPVWKINFPAVTICSNNKMVNKQFNKALKKEP